MTYQAPVGPDERARLKRLAYLRDIGVGGYTSSTPVRARVRFLHDELGVTYDTIADRSGVDAETVKMHYRGYRWPDLAQVTTCTKGTERRILGARFSPSDGYRFPAVGIRRRLQALQAAGFTLAVTSGLVERDTRQVHATMSGRTNKHFVTSPFAQAVITAYDKLQYARPEDWGVAPRASAHALTRSRANSYAPPTCWDQDTIDDPDAVPEWTGACGTPLGYRIHRREGIPVCPPCQAADGARDKDAPGGLPGFSPGKLRALREDRGLSRRQLSDAVGVDDSTVYYWETGRSAPSRQNKIDLLLSVLGATIEDLCESEDA